MSKYTTDINAMSIPWVDSPFAYALINQRKFSTDKENRMLWNFVHSGYTIVDLGLTDEFIESIKSDMHSILNSENKKLQASHVHDSSSPRLFEAWRYSENIKALACHPKIKSTIEWIYGRAFRPFQTINFFKGAENRLHQDSLHFYTYPENWVVGSWVALEDMTEDNGTLCFYPESHKLPCYDFQHLNFPKQKYGEEAEAYKEYSNFIEEVMEAGHYFQKNLICKKGECLIWNGKLVHGSIKVKDPNSTRYSQACHWYAETGVNHYYCPMFSDLGNGIFSDKDLTSKDILGKK